MAASLQDIKNWLVEGKDKGATHVIIICDTWDWDDYPHFVMPGEDPRDYKPGNMQRIVECYAMHLDIEHQLSEFRSYHWEMPREST